MTFEDARDARDDQTRRMREFARRGDGIGAVALYQMLTQEMGHGPIDWREAALSLAQLANEMHEMATKAITLQPPPTVIMCKCGCGLASS